MQPDVVEAVVVPGLDPGVEPLIVEVSADVAWSGRSFRHPLRYLGARPELDPARLSANFR